MTKQSAQTVIDDKDYKEAISKQKPGRAHLRFADGTIDLACPPLKALLEIMAYGKTADGYGLDTPEVRSQFTRESVLASDWYAARLDAKQQSDEDRLKRAVAGLYEFIDAADNAGVVKRLGLLARREQVQAERVRGGGEGQHTGDQHSGNTAKHGFDPVAARQKGAKFSRPCRTASNTAPGYARAQAVRQEAQACTPPAPTPSATRR